MDDLPSLKTLRQQYGYEQDVNIEIGEKLIGGFDKIVRKAKWLNGDTSPIVVVEMKGQNATNEVLLYITLDHPNIIKTYGLVNPNGKQIFNTESVLLLQEYAEAGDLGKLLQERIFIPNQSVLLEIFIQISHAMVYLSQQKIIHGDLACRNVLVIKSHPEDPKKNLVKLIDFGLAQNLSNSSITDVIYPIRYAAPEIIRNHGRTGYSQKSDVYSFAVLMWEACSSGYKIPYGSISDDNDVGQRKLNGELLSRPDECNTKLWTLMLECWKNEPTDRPDFKMICSRLKEIQRNERLSITKMSSSDEYDRNIFEQSEKILNFKNEQNQNFEIEDSSRHSSSSETDIDDFGPCEFCYEQFRIDQLTIHQENCPKNRRKKITSSNSNRNQLYRENKQYSSSFDQSKNRSSQNSYPKTNTNFIPKLSIHLIENLPPTQFPCEICNKLFLRSELSQHQTKCIKQDQDRIEKKRIQIESQENVTEIVCKHCNREFSIDDLNDHENDCVLNSLNSSKNRSVVLEKRSFSTPVLNSNSETRNSTRKPSNNTNTKTTKNNSKNVNTQSKLATFFSRFNPFKKE